MDDLIRRSDAIRLIKRWKDNHEDVEEPIEKAEIQGFNLGLVTAEREVAKIPAVEPKHGEWIETSEGTMCSNCHKFPYDDGEYHIANWHSDFCPYCGARMFVKDTNVPNKEGVDDEVL